MNTLKVICFLALVILELLAIVVIFQKNKALKGENALKLGLSLVVLFTATALLTFFYFKVGPGWDGMISFFFMCIMILTYAVNESRVKSYNEDAYNESKKVMNCIKWISIVMIILSIITTAPRSPYWVR